MRAVQRLGLAACATGRKLWSMVNKGPYLAVQIGW